MNAGLLQLMQQGGAQPDPRMMQSQGLAQLQGQGLPQPASQTAPFRVVPNTRTGPPPPVVTTQEQYDAVPIGAPFIDGRDGKTYFKTQSGQVVPVSPDGSSGQ